MRTVLWFIFFYIMYQIFKMILFPAKRETPPAPPVQTPVQPKSFQERDIIDAEFHDIDNNESDTHKKP